MMPHPTHEKERLSMDGAVRLIERRKRTGTPRPTGEEEGTPTGVGSQAPLKSTK